MIRWRRAFCPRTPPQQVIPARAPQKQSAWLRALIDGGISLSHFPLCFGSCPFWQVAHLPLLRIRHVHSERCHRPLCRPLLSLGSRPLRQAADLLSLGRLHEVPRHLERWWFLSPPARPRLCRPLLSLGSRPLRQ